MKKVKLPTVEAQEILEDLDKRLEQFFVLADHATVTAENKAYHEGQAVAFQAVRLLIKQLRKRGEIWNGGYDDEDEGSVVYTDQVQSVIDRLN